MGLGGRGHVIAWTENGQDKWEFVDAPDMLIYLYDKAVAGGGKDTVYLFEAKVLNVVQMEQEIAHWREVVNARG